MAFKTSGRRRADRFYVLNEKRGHLAPDPTSAMVQCQRRGLLVLVSRTSTRSAASKLREQVAAALLSALCGVSAQTTEKSRGNERVL
jgi:hypothetical protein